LVLVDRLILGSFCGGFVQVSLVDF